MEGSAYFHPPAVLKAPYPDSRVVPSPESSLQAKIARQHGEIERILQELESLGEATIDSEDFATTFQALESAVSMNFALEEKTMRDAAMDPDMFHGHFADHSRFIEFFSDTYLLAANRGRKTARDIVQELRRRIADHVDSYDAKLEAIVL